MACPDENAMIGFLESQLVPAEALGIEEHFAECATCRRALVEYAALAGPKYRAEPTGPATTAGPRGDRTELGRRVAYAQALKRVGTVLCGKWQVDRLISIGGMAHVFAGVHCNNGRQLALKVLRPELTVEPPLVERFLREGYVANKVRHAGAVAVLDDGMTSDGAPFLVMELLDGSSLGRWLHEHGPLAVDHALRIIDDTLDVLAAAHDSGIVHRDIKPDNLFETADGAVKVLDFGIARLREDLRLGGQTETGTTMGTVGYMAPEQARGRTAEIDARTDIWAIGATLFTLLTGRTLHAAESSNESLLLAMTEPVAPVRTLAPGLPAAVCGLLDKALAFEKARRFVDCREMRSAVQRARAAPDEAAAAPEARTVPRTRRAWTIGAAVATTVIAAAGGRMLLRSTHAATTTASEPAASALAVASDPGRSWNAIDGAASPSPPVAASSAPASTASPARPPPPHRASVATAGLQPSVTPAPSASVFNPLQSRH